MKLKDEDLTGETNSFVYIPPEVLDGELYTSASDVYSMGILIWEVWQDQQVFEKERAHSIENFKSLEKPWKVMMDGVTHCPKTSSTISSVVKDCMARAKQDRPSMGKFEDRWRQKMADLKIG